MRRLLGIGSTTAFAIVVLVACATSGDGGPCPSGYVTLPGQAECAYQCTPGPNAPGDPIDAQFTDENCDGTDGVVATCLFVASDGTDSPNAGIPSAPMKTIAYAITQGKDRTMDVCVSGETYQGTVNMVGGVSVYGGFNEHDPDFAFRRGASAISTLEAKGSVVVAQAIDADTYLEGFVINASISDPPATGLGTYGVRMLGGTASLYVRYNVITAGPGQDGAAGTDGSTGAPGANGKDGEIGCDGCETAENPNPPGGSQGGPAPVSPCGGASGGAGGQGGYDQSAGNGGGAGTGANSQGGGGGTGDSTCEVSSGGDGTVGGSPTDLGANGTDGVASAATGTLAMDATYTLPQGTDGSPGAPGNAGGGGGGGGGGTNGGLCKGDRGAGGGSGGTGGCGGTQGTAGASGGASFGVSAVAGKLVCGGNTITSSKGGAGGNGGKGGAGGPGAAGGVGKGRNDDGGASGGGGKGSAGGTGGNGAGGAGGPSACIALTAGVVVDQTPVNRCSQPVGGAGGAGGNGAPNAGPMGASSQVLTL